MNAGGGSEAKALVRVVAVLGRVRTLHPSVREVGKPECPTPGTMAARGQANFLSDLQPWRLKSTRHPALNNART